MVQWLRICLPMQGTQVQSLVGKISHALGQLSLCATTTEPILCNYRSLGAQGPCSATREASAVRSPCTATRADPARTTRESPMHSNKDPEQLKINKYIFRREKEREKEEE